MMAESHCADAFAISEWHPQANAIAGLQAKYETMVPAAEMWPAPSRLAAAHALIMQPLDDSTMEQTLEAMTRQVQGLPALALVPEVYQRQAAEMLERWRALEASRQRAG